MKDNRDLNVMQLEAKAYVARLLQEFDMMMQGARALRQQEQVEQPIIMPEEVEYAEESET